MFTAEFYELVESMMAKVTKRRMRKANKAKKCIRVDCNEPQAQGKRDLCDHHYNQYDYGRRCAAKKSVAALKKYERESLRDGLVGPPHRGSSEKNEYKNRVGISNG